MGLAGLWFAFGTGETVSDEPAIQPEQAENTEQVETAEPEAPRAIRIAAVGDMLPHDTVNLRAEVGDGYDYTPFFTNVQPYVADADIVFCNQESPSAGNNFGVTGYPTFNAPVEFSRDLEKFGCNVINLANNHVADKGQDGVNGTLDTWKALSPLAVSGANRDAASQAEPAYFEVGGRKIAFIAFTDLSNNTSIPSHTINMFSDSLVERLATEAAANADFVIASAHWGVEDSSTVTVGQRNWAKMLAQNGVDLIIGTGPHVLQPVEKIGNTYVFYSLGNFLSTQLEIEQLTGGIAYIDVPLGEGAPTVSFLPTYMHYTWSADEAAVEDLLARNNLNLYPLDKAESRIADSLFDTTMQEQLTRITKLLNAETPVEILTSD